MHEASRPRSESRPAVARLLTAPGEGGIAVIALSGEGAAEALDRLFSGKGSSLAEGAIAYGWIAEDGRRIDEALVWRTGDGFEIGLHGGAAATSAALRAFRRAGVRVETSPAAPAGSIEAEAAVLLPRAATLPAAMMLAAAASGALARALESRDPDVLRGLLRRAPATILLATPCIVAIAGPPNAGKSTLLNALTRRDRALVHPQAGTTRDPVEALADFGGYPVRLVDTAGLAGATGGIDAEAERLAREAAAEALIVLWLEDPSFPSPPAGRAHIRLSGKADLGGAVPEALRVSGVSGEGLEDLKRAVIANLGLPWPATAEPGPFLARHVDLLTNALRSAERPALL